jgi:hypothetical protein
MLYLDELFRARAEKAGVIYVDVWDGFVDEQGRFAQQGPDFEGQIRRLRTGDGIHFTKAGAIKLAHYVEHDLRRVLSNRLAPMAMPAPDEQSPKTPGGRPAIGPVVPLTATAGGEGGDLVGAGTTPPPAKADPVALHVFSRGDALTAPAGRADNFAWPRTDATATAAAAPEAAPPAPALAAPIVPAPAAPAPAAKASGGKTDVKKLEPKAQNAPNAAPETPPARPRRSRADLDGGPRPPMPLGPSNYR